MNAITIIEGPDGAGKTTLARAWQSRWTHAWRRGVMYYHHQGPYRRDPFVESMDLVRRHRADAVIFDRFHVGEQVYGPIYRGTDALGVAGRRMLERALLARGALLVLALPPFEDARANWAKRKAEGGEMFPDETGYRKVYDGFRSARSHLPSYVYDFTRTSVDVALHAAEALRPSMMTGGPGAGHWAPGRVVLIVGDRQNPNVRARWGPVPFAARGGCNEWLAAQLEARNVREDQLYWVNAHDRRGRPTDPLFLDALRPLAIVALGKEATAWARRAGHRALVAPHPAFWKRFHYHAPYPFPNLTRILCT